jgi:peptidoglycan/xylan/chitin deacetylase (PgdA/CDA1 family)
MVGSRLAGIRITRWTVFCLGLLTCSAPNAAFAVECPGHPDAIGISRTLVVDPREHPRIGSMQYRETLPLRDHEIVLTFDDGPVPKYSNQILQILADNCAKAIFFTIGRQAQASPEGVRKLVAAGQTVGTHSQNHPLTFNKMPMDKAKPEVDAGIASTTAALDDPSKVAPFFRVPGLLHGEAVEEYAASLGIQIWSADFLADDWRHIPSSRVYDLAIKRIEARGKGILLLHDIQARTVAALPRILHELKARGYHVVQVVPATPQQPATPTQPEQWLSHPSAEAIAALRWPKVPNFVFAEAVSLPAPALSDFNSPDGALLLAAEPFDYAKRHGVPTPREAPWPRLAALPPENTLSALPAPAASLFSMPDRMAAPPQPPAPASHHAEQTVVPAAQEAEAKAAASVAARGTIPAHAAVADELAGARMRAGHGARRTRHVTHGARRSVKVASLKKR